MATKQITVLLCSLILFTSGCVSDPVGVTERTQIRNDADTAQAQIDANSDIAIAEAEALAYQAAVEAEARAVEVSAEQDRIARQTEAEQQARSEIAQADAEARAKISIHNSWSSVVLLGLLALCMAALTGVWMSLRYKTVEAYTQPQITTETWRALQLEAHQRGQRIELEGSTMLLIDSQTNAIVAQREVNQ